MKIIIDDKIPYIAGVLEPYAEVSYVPGFQITAQMVKDADALVIRTRTFCNRQLLEGSSVKFIATATIGYDHIDTGYCEQNGIRWANAPGCNSKSVEQYVAAALLVWAAAKNKLLKDQCIGIVGVGNVGSKVARFCSLLGMKVLLNDPPRERAEGTSNFVSLRQIMAEANIITLHVPLNMQGDDATYHLGDSVFFAGLQRNPLIINTCRGEVVDTQALKNALQMGQVSDCICDCWENEPNIDAGLLAASFLATPHIAGYSRDGKATGTQMSIAALSSFFGLGIDQWQPTGIEAPEHPVFKPNANVNSEQDMIAQAVTHTYDIRHDDHSFRKGPSRFEKLRGDYPARREFGAFTIVPDKLTTSCLDLLKAVGFKIYETQGTQQ